MHGPQLSRRLPFDEPTEFSPPPASIRHDRAAADRDYQALMGGREKLVRRVMFLQRCLARQQKQIQALRELVQTNASDGAGGESEVHP